MELKNAQSYRPDVLALLKQAALPFEDLPTALDSFVVAVNGNSVIGAAGIEAYDNIGLLRSVVVDPEYQGKGIAGQLLKAVEEAAITAGIGQLILLTETASPYFERKGFKQISRDEVPEAVKPSSEFSHVCPVSAIVLSKSLITHI